MLEVGPFQRRRLGLSKEKIGDVAPAEPRQGEDAASDIREAKGGARVDESQFSQTSIVRARFPRLVGSEQGSEIGSVDDAEIESMLAVDGFDE